jgi:hypothetical protein
MLWIFILFLKISTFFMFELFENVFYRMIPLQAALAEKVGAESPGRNNISPLPEE